jgi:hypothetical protein
MDFKPPVTPFVVTSREINMKRTHPVPKAPPNRVRPGLACAALLASLAMQVQAADVKPPPPTPGSNMVRIQGGMNPEEAKREARAHHHKGHVRKDFTRDDSRDGNGNGGNGQQKNPGGRS